MRPGCSARASKSQVTGMARQFMLGNDEKEIAATLRKLHEQGIAFTVDVLGEAVVSEAEADEYAATLPAPDGFAGRRNGADGQPLRQQRFATRPVARAECLSEALGSLLPDPPDRPGHRGRENLHPAAAHPATGRGAGRLHQSGYGELRAQGTDAAVVQGHLRANRNSRPSRPAALPCRLI